MVFTSGLTFNPKPRTSVNSENGVDTIAMVPKVTALLKSGSLIESSRSNRISDIGFTAVDCRSGWNERERERVRGRERKRERLILK